MHAINGYDAFSYDSATPIPDPQARFVRLLAAHAFEAVEGIRSISQLGGVLSVGAARQLALQRNALRERNAVYRDPRQCTASPGRMRLCRVLPHVAEVSVVVHTERRAHAVALRLEWVHSRWRASEVHVMYLGSSPLSDAPRRLACTQKKARPPLELRRNGLA